MEGKFWGKHSNLNTALSAGRESFLDYDISVSFRTTEFLDFGLVLRQLQISDCRQSELYSHIFDDEGTNLHKYVACVLIKEFSSIE